MTAYYRVYDNQEHATHGGKFDSLEGAESKALELAAKYPGSSFEILRCVGIAQTSKASTFWMDGEQPCYRMLEVGETIQEGDEFLSTLNGWQPYMLLVGSRVSNISHPTRRPL